MCDSGVCVTVVCAFGVCVCDSDEGLSTVSLRSPVPKHMARLNHMKFLGEFTVKGWGFPINQRLVIIAKNGQLNV